MKDRRKENPELYEKFHTFLRTFGLSSTYRLRYDLVGACPPPNVVDYDEWRDSYIARTMAKIEEFCEEHGIEVCGGDNPYGMMTVYVHVFEMTDQDAEFLSREQKGYMGRINKDMEEFRGSGLYKEKDFTSVEERSDEITRILCSRVEGQSEYEAVFD